MTTGLELLRQPFAANQISYLPKGGVKLAYVGHAALTDRLLDADPNWTWEPLAMSENGLPVMDDMGGMWIRLTVCGVTRLGYGHAGSKTGGDAIKEVIGDALRNAAMRFGAALDLWHKGDLHGDEKPLPASIKHSPTDGPIDVSDDRKTHIELAASAAANKFKLGEKDAAYDVVSEFFADNEEALYMHTVLKPHSTLRAYIKFRQEAAKKPQPVTADEF